ncbi:unnamed protein product [Lactuca virosa]|uniref:S-locus receptor kinase C-terminal domain-containing protein n=1 Tax=Lactuca virosa TaxID=75947 RepID=A0AAU9MLF7_9ASTR|nr:unnamed protein product [Lactuca virosa]
MDVDSSIITRYIQIGLLCVQVDAAERPTMDEVIVMLLRGSSLTLQIPKEPVMLTVSMPSMHDIDEYEDLETLEPDDENNLQKLVEDHNFEISETVQDFIQELNLNPR